MRPAFLIPGHRLSFLISGLLLVGLNLFALTPGSGHAQEVFIDLHSPSQLDRLQVIDVRSRKEFEESHLRDSLWLEVNTLDDPNPSFPGKLGSLDRLQLKLGSAGISAARPILIVGSTIAAFGEDGRLFWILHRFSSIPVQILNGGFKSLKHLPETMFQSSGPHGKAMPSSFIEDGNPISLKVPEELFSYDDFKLESKFRIFDVRSLPEYMGATPFGSSRGGHIPGAKWIPWNSFFDGSGKVLDTRKKEIVSKMGGIRPLVYCTAGYRSALVFAVLLEWGLEPINYDGSWYEYSQRSSPTH